jgi:hypothetical protein
MPFASPAAYCGPLPAIGARPQGLYRRTCQVGIEPARCAADRSVESDEFQTVFADRVIKPAA